MDYFSDLYRVLKVQSMTCVLQHNYVIVSDADQVLIVKLGIVKDLPLERICSVKEQAAALKIRIQIIRKAINMLLVFIDSF